MAPDIREIELAEMGQVIQSTKEKSG